MRRPAASLLLLFALLLVSACSAKRYTYNPNLPMMPDAAFIDKIDVGVSVWEDVRATGPVERVGGRPTYLETLRATLERLDLFEQFQVLPWRPEEADVVLHLSDRPVIDMHYTAAQRRLWATLMLLGIPIPVFKYHASIRSEIDIQSEPLPGLDPLHITRTLATDLSGKFLDFYGADDERQLLSARHALYVAEVAGAAFVEQREWFGRARLAVEARDAPAAEVSAKDKSKKKK